MPLVETKEFRTKDMKGIERVYLLSKIPASYSYEIVLQYPTSALPKVGDPVLHMSIVFKIVSYVGIPRDTPGLEPLQLTTRELADNHIPDLRTWMAVLRAMASYNWDFFLPDDISDFWGRLKTLLVMWSQETSADSSPPSSIQAAQAFTS